MLPLHDKNPRHGKPVITVLLIAVNAVMFFYELSLGQRLEGFVMTAAFVPGRYAADGLTLGDLGPGLSTALLSMFLHGGWGHFLGNMLFLWVFGDNVEDRLGHFRYLVFYLLCGYAATFAHLWFNPASALPAIGASGAISGVLGAYLFLHPKARIQTLLFLGFLIQFIYVPAWVFLPIWFLIQLFSGVASLGPADAQEAGGVAFFAHIGGFVAGPLLLFLLGGRRRPEAPQRRGPEPVVWR